MGHPVPAPATNAEPTDSWPTQCSKAVSEWKNRTITYLKNTDIYKFFDKNFLSLFRNLSVRHPVIYAVALAALSVLIAVLTFNLALSALKQTVSSVVPITMIVLYSQMLLLMANKIFQAKQAVQRANV